MKRLWRIETLACKLSPVKHSWKVYLPNVHRNFYNLRLQNLSFSLSLSLSYICEKYFKVSKHASYK